MSADTETLHEHEPTEPIAAFEFVCKRCGQLIEAEHCRACDGIGSFASLLGRFECADCKGTGRKRWVLIP